MNLFDLREGAGCPSCVGGQPSFFWSGADIGVNQILAGGLETLDAQFDDLGWPVFERSRCIKCGAIWEFEFRWVDRPPLFLVGKVVDQTS